MRNVMLAVMAAACVAAAVVAQGDPQPTCRMCPGTYIPKDELDAYVKKAIGEKLTDQQVRDVEIGKAHIGIGVVHRGKLASPAPDSVAEHDQVSEVYHIIEGTATLMLGPDIVGAKRRNTRGRGTPTRVDPERRLVRSEAGRRRRDPRGHGPLVHEDRRPRHLSDGADRSRQGNAPQERGRLEGVPREAAPGAAVISESALVAFRAFFVRR